MGIKQICNSISHFFNKVRTPFPQIQRMLWVCSLVKRPGLSVIQSTANIVKDMNRLGIPTDPMPDGSDNLMVAYTFVIVKEIFRALKLDAVVQVGLQPGSISFTGYGANAGGPIVVNGTNIGASSTGFGVGGVT